VQNYHRENKWSYGRIVCQISDLSHIDSTRNLNTDIFIRKVSQRLLRILSSIEDLAHFKDLDTKDRAENASFKDLDAKDIEENEPYSLPPAFNSWRQNILSEACKDNTLGHHQPSSESHLWKYSLQSSEQVQMEIDSRRGKLLDAYNITTMQHSLAKAMFLGKSKEVRSFSSNCCGADLQGQPGYMHFPTQEKCHKEIFSCVVEAVRNPIKYAIFEIWRKKGSKPNGRLNPISLK
jgi:hypothetical protein